MSRHDFSVNGPASIMGAFRTSPEGTLRYAVCRPTGWYVHRVGPSGGDDTTSREGLSLADAILELAPEHDRAVLVAIQEARLVDHHKRLERALERHASMLLEYRQATGRPAPVDPRP